MSRILDSPKGSDILIRPAAPEDAASINELARSARIDFWTVEQYKEESIRDDAVFVVASIAEVIVGFVSGRIVPGSDSRYDGEIYNVAVAADWRRKGIGSSLIRAAIARFRSAACGSVWLEVRVSNLAAIQLYASKGFISAGDRRNFYSDPPEDAVVMRLDLAGNKAAI